MRGRPLDGSTHRRQSGGWHGRWGVRNNPALVHIASEADRCLFRIMTGNYTIYLGSLLVTDNSTMQCQA